MPYVLTDEALQFLEDNPIAAANFAVLVGLKTSSIATALLRKSKSLNTWHSVEYLAREMKLKPKDILKTETDGQ